MNFIKKIIFNYNSKRTRPITLFKDKNGLFYRISDEYTFYNLAYKFKYDLFSMNSVTEVKQKPNGVWYSTDNIKHYKNSVEFWKDDYELVK